MEISQEKIDGLIALMQKGIYEGERTAARKALERICAKYGIDLEALLAKSEETPEEYHMTLKTLEEAKIFMQCVFRFGDPGDGDVWTRRDMNKKTVFYKILPVRQIELMAIWEVLHWAFLDERAKIRKKHREENKLLGHAFVIKHRLFGKGGGSDRKPTIGELLRAHRAAQMAGGMEDVALHKQIAAPQ